MKLETHKNIEWKLMNDIRTEHITCCDLNEYLNLQ